MTRAQVLRRQILAALGILAGLLALLGVHGYLNTFAHRVPLGTLTEATLVSSGGGLPPWKDPALLAEIQAALPRYKAGPGYAAHEHGHESMALVLVDDRGRQVALELPAEGSMVTVDARPGVPEGNSWPMPRLLAVLAKHGLPELQARHLNAPTLEFRLQTWRDSFGKSG